MDVTLGAKMIKIPKQECTAEFKTQAVKRVAEVGSIGRVAEELDLVEQTLRNWVKASKAGKLNPTGANAITPEQMELSRLRAENVRLKLECVTLKKGACRGGSDRRKSLRGKMDRSLLGLDNGLRFAFCVSIHASKRGSMPRAVFSPFCWIGFWGRLVVMS